jgi:hypothetical protein
MWKIKSVDEARSGETTLYTRHGDVFVIACAVAGSVLFLASLIPRGQR